jgi:hypothetical protein
MSGYRYLKDKPIGKDLFESGSHNRIANSIVELINDNQEKMIGLEGEWGSGKSNVIEIIGKSLEDSHYIFIYDAWGHQEDLQRRSFLEELTSEICQEELVEDENNWEEKLKNLLSRKTSNTTKQIPKFNNAFLVILITLFLNSRFNELSIESIKSITPNTIESILRNGVSNEFLKALLLEVPRNLPIITVTIVWFFRRIIKHIGSGKGLIQSLEGIWNDLTQMLYIYKEQELEKRIDTITSTKEPSVTEFKKWMHDLSSSLKNKKLVIVFDNMDRLPPSKVKELWSSIHTFFSEEKYKNIWTIIPFDREHIKEAFEIENDRNTNNNSKIANNFINKTFSIVYRISPPVMSDWKSFFKLKFEEAFPALEEKEIIVLRNLYDLENDIIKPRDIILFINELVSLKRVWREEVPMKYLALFILRKEIILEDPLQQILHKEFISKSAHLFDNKVEKYISALVYNVSFDNASQVVLGREIEVNLRNQNIEKLKELSLHIDFMKVLENVVQGIENLENTTLSLAKVLDEIEENNQFKKFIWDTLVSKFLEYNIKEISFKEFFKEIILKSNNRIDEVLNYILKSYAKIEDIVATEYYYTLTEIESFISDNDISFNLSNHLIKVNLSTDEFINFVSLAREEYSKYSIFADLNLVEKYYLEKLPNSLDNDLKLDIIKYLKKEYDFKNLKNQLEDILKNNLAASNLEYVYKLYFNFLDEPLPLDKPTKYKWDLNQIATALNSNQDENSDKFYILVSLLISNVENASDINNINNVSYRAKINKILNSNDEDLIKGSAKFVEYFKAFGDVLSNVITLNRTLIIRLAEYLIINPVMTSRLDIKNILEKYDGISKAISCENEDFIKRINGWSYYLTEKLDDSNIFEIIQSEKILYDSINLNNKTTRYIRECYKKNLLHRSKEDFLIELRNTGLTYIMKVLRFLINKKIISKATEELTEAYKTYIIEIVEKSYNITDDKEQVLNLIYGIIDKRKIRTTFRNTRDLYIREYDINCKEFLFFIPKFKKHNILYERSGEVVRRIIIPVIDEIECLNYIMKNEEYFIRIINNADESKIDLVSKINQKLGEGIEIENLEGFIEKIELPDMDEEEVAVSLEI